MLPPTSEILKEPIGDKIKSVRDEKGLSQAELAEKLGCARATIVNIESGGQLPTLDFIFDIAKVLGCSYLDLLPTQEEIDQAKSIRSEIMEGN